MSPPLPRYPIYIISKGRAGLSDSGSTAFWLRRDGTPFRLVVEPTETDEYAKTWGRDCLLELPFHDLGLGGIPARNWVWEHAKESGARRHWILDDNVKGFRRMNRGLRIVVDTRFAFSVLEDFVDRYENIAVAGMNYQGFVTEQVAQPFYLNVHVYSVLLIDNALPFRWRGRYNEDTDLCLQALSRGHCTVLFNSFCADKSPTMTVAGGNTAELYQGDGRLKMARSLEQAWPHVVTVDRRWRRPQHVVNWKRFKTPLIRRTDIDWDTMPAVDEHGIRLQKVTDEAIRHPDVAAIYDSLGS
jgi:hypothetical protein